MNDSENNTNDAIRPRRFASLRKRRAPIVLGLFVLGAVSLLLAAGWPLPEDRLTHKALWREVRRTDLSISVIERGNLESQENVEIFCEVEDVQRDGINGTPIVWIIPNGASVEEGDLLCELETTPMREALDEQVLETEEARTEQFQAEANYDNQITTNETTQAEAELAVELAELNLEMFTDKESGTHRLAVEEIKRSIDNTNNEILAAQASLELKDDDRNGLQSLFKLGYANRNELRRSELSYLQAEGEYAAKLNELQTSMATLRKKQDYERRMQLMELEGALETAKRAALQTKRSNEARLAQLKSLLRTRTEQLKKEEERLKRYETQLELCKIYAPQAGMVAYASDRNNEVREGVPVRNRQHLMSIPRLDSMQVRTAVHESVLDQIDSGLDATVTIDAFPDRRYQGKVQSVAVLPDQSGWRGSGTKVYETVVTVDAKVKGLKPGMTAVTEIHIDQLTDIIAVPIQAVMQHDDDTWCIVRSPQGIRPVTVTVGRSNDAYVEIIDGLQPGEDVALNPTDLAGDLFEDESDDEPKDQA